MERRRTDKAAGSAQTVAVRAFVLHEEEPWTKLTERGSGVRFAFSKYLPGQRMKGVSGGRLEVARCWQVRET